MLAEAGSGLLYVGARGTWYPNRGMAMADFDLEFTFPAKLDAVATGNPTPVSEASAAAKANESRSATGFRIGRFRWPDSTWGSTKWRRRMPGTSRLKPMRRRGGAGFSEPAHSADGAAPVASCSSDAGDHSESASPAQNEATVEKRRARRSNTIPSGFGRSV